MLRTGAILLTLWAALHLLVSMGILAMVLLSGRNAPALIILFGDISGGGIDPRALATINYLAVLCNAWRGAFCLLALVVVWAALVRKARWALWALAGGAVLIEAVSLVGDQRLPHGDPGGVIATSCMAIVGLVFAFFGIARKTF